MGFEIFSDIFGFHHLGYEGIKHLLSLGVDLGAVLVELALGQEGGEEDGVVLLQVVLMQHTPFAEVDG